MVHTEIAPANLWQVHMKVYFAAAAAGTKRTAVERKPATVTGCVLLCFIHSVQSSYERFALAAEHMGGNDD
jgi:hypothetical protein